MSLKINICYGFQKGAWGGGNQFLKALRDEFKSLNVYCENIEESNIILFNAHQCANEVLKLKKDYPQKIFAHRTDGIYKLYNKPSDARQDMVFGLNREVANCTVFQTNWAKNEHVNFGLELNKPHTVIGNAPNKELFHSNYKKEKSGKTKLVCTSWSINKNKGFDYYKYLDDNLDFNKYSFTYIGNDPGIKFKNIKKIGPFNSSELSTHLKSYDIFLTASRHECCSNSLLEAMSCGLPAIGLNSGGTPEIINKGGELFKSKVDLIDSIDRVSSNLLLYSSNINIPSINDIANLYISFFEEQL